MMPADPVDAVVAAFRAEGMKGDPEEIERFARVAVETCERDTVRLVEAGDALADAIRALDSYAASSQAAPLERSERAQRALERWDGERDG